MSEPKNETPATEDQKPAAKKVKMVKVKLLRPFRINEKIYDKVGSIVSVPESDLPWLTKSNRGQAQGFGDRLNEETVYHDLAKAVLVEGSVAA